MNKQFNLMDALKICVRRWWVLVIGVVLGGMISGLYTEFFIQPKYTSVATLYSENTNEIVEHDETNVSLNTIVTRQTLVKTYAEVLSSNIFLKKVAKETDLGYTYSQIHNMLSMTSRNGTEILVIRVSTKNPEHSYKIAKCIMELASDQVGEVVGGGSMNPIDEPEVPTSPSSPNKPKNIQLGIMIGFILSIVVVLLVEVLDNKVKSAEQVSDGFNYPVLGEIPFYSTGNKIVDVSRAEVYYSSDT